VIAAAALGPGELGAFLRREGVHEAELEQWRVAVMDGATSALEGGTTRSSSRGADAKRIKELERQIRRKDKALAETAALLVLQKKVHEIWGDGDDDTNDGNEK
jgi:transposase